MFNKIEKVQTANEIVNQIISSISKGELQPGSLLPSERDLAQMFNVSRVVVREAISALSLLGIIQKKWGKGNFISENVNLSLIRNSVKHLIVVKEQEVIEVVEARMAVECELAALAAVRRTSTDLNRLKKALDDYLKSSRESPKRVELDLSFHMTIAEIARSRILEGLQKVLSEKYFSIMQIGTRLDDAMKSAEQEHTQIFEAIRNSDEAMAREVMRSHLVRLARRIVTHLKNIGDEKTLEDIHSERYTF
ncbi:FadR/GntR family transcriptional regulator [Thermotoga profunda]|uniref:FadR/GntR family transcriptional regulator n=1 Tax=Thermotoga profunda TaxID=1508420 RepID=UPI00059774FE|nr:FadR/GntR family transcriptional regulator [Thermotoga profunda]